MQFEKPLLAHSFLMIPAPIIAKLMKQNIKWKSCEDTDAGKYEFSFRKASNPLWKLGPSIVRIIIIIIRLFKLGSSPFLMRAHSGIFFTFISEALLNILKV